MAYQFVRSISEDTPNQAVSTGRLASEIEASSISSALLYVQTDGDEVTATFESDLSPVDLATMEAILAAHSGAPLRGWILLTREGEMEPVIPGASKVVANDRPAIEIQNGVTGYAALQVMWPLVQYEHAEMRIRVYFIIKQSGTGSNVRIAARMKAQGPGDDSSAAFAVAGFSVAPVDFITVGTVFSADVILAASGASLGDSVAVQIGRDGENLLGAGTSDDVDQPIQIMGLQMEAR